MHLERISKELRNKIIAGVVAFVMMLGGFMGFKHQQNKIDDLQYQLQIKQDNDNRDSGKYITFADVQSIENEFNKLNSYTVFTGTMNLKHTYKYERDSVLGLKSKGTLTANATVYYEFKVDLANAEISVDYDTNTINIVLPRASLNVNSVHRKNNTFKKLDKECSRNLLLNDRDGALLQRYWEETFDISAIDKLNECYESKEKEEYLAKVSKMEVLDLINTLKLNKVKVNVDIK